MSGARTLPVLSDRIDRIVTYLRVSLTDRCNYRCTYCMPAEGIPHFPRKEVLDFEEVERVVRVFSELGVRRVRLTGGEPTVRKNVVEIVERIARLPLINEVVMTTNGSRLSELATPLAQAGLRSINVSIDTLVPEDFQTLTRRGQLQDVLGGIEAARAAGLSIKLNAVLLRRYVDQVVPLCEYAWRSSCVPRFIEHMPMSSGDIFGPEQHVPAVDAKSLIESAIGEALVPATGEKIAGPARYYRTERTERRVGFISPISEHFCATCNRVRVTARGDLHTCLAFDDAVSLRDLIRSGATDAGLREAIFAALGGKRDGHQFTKTGGGAPAKHMISMGG